MLAFLVSLGASLNASVFKWGLVALLALGSGAGGFIWGELHAAAIAATAAAKDADARVAAVQKSDQALLTDYLAKISAQTARGEALSSSLAKDESQLAVNAAKAKEAITHAIPQDSSCDLSVAALGLLNAQRARR